MAASMAILCAACGTTAAPSPSPTVRATAIPTRAPTETATVAPSPQPKQTAAVQRSPTASKTVVPTATSILSPTRTPEVKVYDQSLVISTYPFAPFLESETHPLYGMTVFRLNRAAYDVSGPAPEPKTYQTLVVENAYLKLTFLPELGGRLYQCLFKPTNQTLFYNNAVLKPSYWGPLPRDENWWLAAGGLEWAFPVHEHGYEWGAPWEVSVRREGERVTVALRRAAGAFQAQVEVSLAAGESRFTVEPRLKNVGDRAVPVQFWANAMLAPGGASVGPGLTFVFPASQAVVHSTGDPAIPGEHSAISWPVVDGRDLSRYANWRNWLGVFAPEPLPPFFGVYDDRADVGVARVVDGVGGVKLFGFGAEFPDIPTFTVDGSSYVELWAGANRTFWPEDDRLLQPGESLGWREVWIPLAGTGGFTDATADAALRLQRDDDGLVLAAYSPVRRKAVLKLTAAGAGLLTRSLLLDPTDAYLEKIAAPATNGPLHLQLFSEDGILLGETALP